MVNELQNVKRDLRKIRMVLGKPHRRSGPLYKYDKETALVSLVETVENLTEITEKMLHKKE